MTHEERIEELAIELYDAYWSAQYLSKPFWALWENASLCDHEGFKAIAEHVIKRLSNISEASFELGKFTLNIPKHR